MPYARITFTVQFQPNFFDDEAKSLVQQKEIVCILR